jgi:IMP dehydrogenase/GMP reductase
VGGERLKAYQVIEAVKGETVFIVHAHTAKEARERYVKDGEVTDKAVHPCGIREVRRAPHEDRRT